MSAGKYEYSRNVRQTMKVIFTVEAESEYDLRVYTQASAMWSTLWDFDQYLRGEMKHSNLTEAEYNAYDKIRDKLHEMLNENDVKLDL